MRIPFSKSLLALSCAIIASCTTVGPDYQKTDTPLPPSYKAVGLSTPPMTGKWWSTFSDPTLSLLLIKAEKANPQSLTALARLDQAHAILGITRSERIPRLPGPLRSLLTLPLRVKPELRNRFLGPRPQIHQPARSAHPSSRSRLRHRNALDQSGSHPRLSGPSASR